MGQRRKYSPAGQQIEFVDVGWAGGDCWEVKKLLVGQKMLSFWWRWWSSCLTIPPPVGFDITVAMMVAFPAVWRDIFVSFGSAAQALQLI